MRTNLRSFIVCLSVMATVFFSYLPDVAAEKVYKMKAQSVWGAVSTTTSEALYKYLDRVEEKSKGRIKFERFADAALAKPAVSLDALQVGMFDVLLSYPSYYTGMVPEGEIFLTPFLFKNMQSIYDIFYNTEAGELIQQAYKEKGSILVGPQIMTTNILSTRKKVENLEQMKGLKIRASGGISTQTALALGTSPVMLVGAEIYTALQRGTVDGYLYSLYSAWDYKFHEQAKYIVQPDMGYVVTYIWVSKKTFDSLPSDLQKVFMEAGKEQAAYNLSKAGDDVKEVWKKLKGAGVQQVDLSEVDQGKLRERFSDSVWSTYLKNDRCKRIMDICLKHEGL